MRASVLVRASAWPTMAGSPASYGGNWSRARRGWSQRRGEAMGPPGSVGPDPIGERADRLQPRRLEGEAVEIDRRVAAQRGQRRLLDGADDQGGRDPRIELADEPGVAGVGELGLDDRDQRVVDLAEDLLDVDVEADRLAEEDAQAVLVVEDDPEHLAQAARR